MNKLQEILEEFDNLPICFNYGEHAAMRKFLSEKLTEYARSVINIETNPLIELPLSDYIRLESAWDKKHKEMFSRINLDLQSLKEK